MDLITNVYPRGGGQVFCFDPDSGAMTWTTSLKATLPPCSTESTLPPCVCVCVSLPSPLGGPRSVGKLEWAAIMKAAVGFDSDIAR
jgi:hypothetical protein